MKIVASRPSNVAVGYARASAVRQAEHQVVIEDQETSIRNFCRAAKLDFIDMFNEGVGSGTIDKRPILVHLMQRIEEGGSGIGYLVVHSYSRFFRDAFELESHRRRLRRHGVKLVSITQPLDEADPMFCSGMVALT